MSERKTIISIVIILFLIFTGSFAYFLIFKKPVVKTKEDILQSLTASAEIKIEVSEKTVESLTAPKGHIIPEDVLRSLTVPK